MTIKNSKFIFLFFIIVFFSGCARNVDLRKQAEENKAQEQKSISSMKGAVDLPVETAQASNIQAGGPVNPVRSKLEDHSASNGVKILFVGDMMFDRHIREAVEKYGDGDYDYVLKPIKDKLAEYNLVVGNLEGPITDNNSISVNTKIGEGKNFVFTFDPAVAKVLAENNIKLVNLGNNHIFNQGAKGLEQTKKYLDESGVEYFGDTGVSDVIARNEVMKQSRDDENGSGSPRPFGARDDRVTFKKISGIRVSFVSYNYSVGNSDEQTVENIKLAKEQSDVIIVCPHWGTEYKTGDPGNSVRVLAYRFVDAGADAVIGTHPHVVQLSEEYNGKKIYYSLGNFVFDQYFQKETMEGLGVEMTVNPGGALEFNELKFEMTKRGQTKVEL